jgi:hypothetical protein
MMAVRVASFEFKRYWHAVVTSLEYATIAELLLLLLQNNNPP